MQKLIISASVARNVLWGSCVVAALVAVACDKSAEEQPAVTTAAVAAEPAPEPEKEEPAEPEAKEPPVAADTAAPEEAPATDEKATVGSKKVVSKPAPAVKQEEPKAEAPKDEGYTGPSPCLKTKFAFSSVKDACNKGGVKQAKALMQTFTKKGKDQGKNWKCSTCHDNTKTYTNKPNAAQELKSIF